MSLLDDIEKGGSAIKSWLGEGGRPVSRYLSQKRADICLMCPKNQKGRGTTRVMGKMVKRLLSLKNRMDLFVYGEAYLHHCEACGCVLPLKVHEPIDLIEQSLEEGEIDLFADPCWIRDEIAQKK